jgi:hypothetical protein
VSETVALLAARSPKLHRALASAKKAGHACVVIDGTLIRSCFRGLLDHLATLTRNQVRFASATATVPILAEPTSTQRQAFDLIGAPIPLTLK